MTAVPLQAVRLDKWLWHGRFFRTRARAAGICAAGKVRLNRVVVTKGHALVRPGDVLTFPQGARIRVVRVAAIAARRGSAMAAAQLYEDLSDPVPPPPPRGGRPTKADRRALERLWEGR